MNTILNIASKVKEILLCGKKRMRRTDDDIDENIIFSIKRRRLSESPIRKISKMSQNLLSVKKSTYYYDTKNYSKFKQTQLLKHSINYNDVSHYRLNIIKNIVQKKSIPLKRKLNFEMQSLTNNNLEKMNLNTEILSFIHLKNENKEIEPININKLFDENFSGSLTPVSNIEKTNLEVEKSNEECSDENLSCNLTPLSNIEKTNLKVEKSIEECSDENLSCNLTPLSNIENRNLEVEKSIEKSSEDVILTESLEKSENSNNYSECEYEYENIIIKVWTKTERQIFPIFEYSNFVMNNENFNLPNFLIISRDSMEKLLPGNCLNDEIINSYIHLILLRQENQKREDEQTIVYIFNTFFYQKYKNEKENFNYSYEKISKIWEKKNISLWDYKYIMIPINLNFHWTLVIINLREKKISYYDSLKCEKVGYYIMNSLSDLFTEYIIRNNDDFLKNKQINEEEITVKLSTSNNSNIYDHENITSNLAFKKINTSNLLNNKLIIPDYNDNINKTLLWNFEFPNVPQQNNGTDCGVFICKFMDCISRNEELRFSQEDINYFRYLIGIELMEGKIITV